jgi:predicted transcriptional regulator with HTH domain
MVRQAVLPFKLERTDETLTAHGGLALLAEFNHGLGVCRLVNRYLPSPGSNRGYAPSVFVDRLILMLQAGGQRLEDLRELTRESGLLRLLSREIIPDPDTVGDWLRRMGDPQTGQAGLVGLGQVRDELTARLLRRDGHTTYTLDADATLVVGEKRDAEWSYTGIRGYMPLLGFLCETPLCLVDEFREGNVSPGAGQLEFYRQCRARMPVGKRLARYRADSASYQAALINELEADHVRWAITADQDAPVKAVMAWALP